MTVLKEIFCSLRNELTYQIKLAKKVYIQSKVNTASNSQKQLFKCVNDLFYKSSEPVFPSNVTKEDLADKFSKFFNDKIKKIYSKFSDDEVSLADNPDVTKQLSIFGSVSVEEIRKLVTAPPTKSCSTDPIPTFLLKDCVDQILTIMTRIINTSLSSATVPQEFKKAVVIPILKKNTLDLK